MFDEFIISITLHFINILHVLPILTHLLFPKIVKYADNQNAVIVCMCVLVYACVCTRTGVLVMSLCRYSDELLVRFLML